MPLSRIKEEATDHVLPMEVHSSRSMGIIADDDDDDFLNNNDENDEIVREIDVVLSPELCSQLYLMQYPLHHQPISIPESAKIKPRHRMIELEQRLPNNIGNEGGFRMSHRTYVSRIVPVSTHLALGKMEADRGGGDGASRLHLIPLSTVMQMRPSFGHINNEQMASATRNDSDEEEESNRNKMEKTPLLFHKKESERAAMHRRSSYAYKKTSEDSEEWKPLEIFGPASPEHGRIIRAVQETPMEENILNMNATGSYVQSLNYLPMNVAATASTTAAAANKTGDTDVSQQSNEENAEMIDPSSSATALCVRLVALLRKGLPVPYNIIKANFVETEDATMFTVLGSCAVLVRGNFVLQSRLLPVPNHVQQARTFLLFLFQSLGVVSRPRLVYAYEKYDSAVTGAAIHDLLQRLGHKTPFGWRCKVGDNVEFCQSFPDQSQLYQQYWERQSTRFEKLWRLYHEC